MYVIHPYYTGRDKGPLRENRVGGKVLQFRTVGEAWYYVFTKVQPNDPRAQDNYVVEKAA